MVPLLKRTLAAQATVDAFYRKPFKLGTNDCVHLVSHALTFLGHDDPLRDCPAYSSLSGARKAMKALGVENFETYLDERFTRIPPAAALPGDIVGIPEGKRLAGLALGIHLGDARVLAFAAEDHSCIWGPDHVCTHAWRVL